MPSQVWASLYGLSLLIKLFVFLNNAYKNVKVTSFFVLVFSLVSPFST